VPPRVAGDESEPDKQLDRSLCLRHGDGRQEPAGKVLVIILEIDDPEERTDDTVVPGLIIRIRAFFDQLERRAVALDDLVEIKLFFVRARRLIVIHERTEKLPLGRAEIKQLDETVDEPGRYVFPAVDYIVEVAPRVRLPPVCGR
jgi:hypothetical protein